MPDSIQTENGEDALVKVDDPSRASRSRPIDRSPVVGSVSHFSISYPMISSPSQAAFALQHGFGENEVVCDPAVYGPAQSSLLSKRRISIAGLPQQKRPKLTVNMSCRPPTPFPPPQAKSWQPSPQHQDNVPNQQTTSMASSVNSGSKTSDSESSENRNGGTESSDSQFSGAITSPPSHNDVVCILNHTRVQLGSFVSNALMYSSKSSELVADVLRAEASELEQSMNILEAALLTSRDQVYSRALVQSRREVFGQLINTLKEWMEP